MTAGDSTDDRATEAPGRFDDRERIAHQLTDTLLRRASAMSLTLHGAYQRAHDTRVRAAIATVLTELDELVPDVRRIVFDTARDHIRTPGDGTDTAPGRSPS